MGIFALLTGESLSELAIKNCGYPDLANTMKLSSDHWGIHMKGFVICYIMVKSSETTLPELNAALPLF